MIDDLKEIRSQIHEEVTQNVAELKTKLQLVEAKGYILMAKMCVAVDHNYDEATAELDGAGIELDKAKAYASQKTKGKIEELRSSVKEVKEHVEDKSDQALDKLADLLEKSRKAIDSLGKEEKKTTEGKKR